MSGTGTQPQVGTALAITMAIALGAYFSFAAIQGDYGVLRRMQIEAEAADLAAERARLAAEVARMENLTRRLSDDYLDLDLLDQQARDVLGLVRPDEIIVR